MSDSRVCKELFGDGFHCERRNGHDGPHQALARVIALPTASQFSIATESEPPSAATLVELLAHLDDLVQLAASENFVRLALELRAVLSAARHEPHRYERLAIVERSAQP